MMWRTRERDRSRGASPSTPAVDFILETDRHCGALIDRHRSQRPRRVIKVVAHQQWLRGPGRHSGRNGIRGFELWFPVWPGEIHSRQRWSLLRNFQQSCALQTVDSGEVHNARTSLYGNVQGIDSWITDCLQELRHSEARLHELAASEFREILR